MAKKNLPSSAPARASTDTFSASPVPGSPSTAVATTVSSTQFTRAVARAYRNRIAQEVSDEVREVILGWMSEDERAHPAAALHIDTSNYNKWVRDGTLQLRTLTQILIQRAKDFTDLHHANSATIIGPENAELLQIQGTCAALLEGYLRSNGRAAALTEDEAFLLLLLYRYSADRGCRGLVHTWVHAPSSGDTKVERGHAEWIKAQLRANPHLKLEDFAAMWSDVCIAVCRVLDQHAGLSDGEA